MKKERIIIGILLIILVCETMFFANKIAFMQSELESKQRIIDFQSTSIEIIKKAQEEKLNDSIP